MTVLWGLRETTTADPPFRLSLRAGFFGDDNKGNYNYKRHLHLQRHGEMRGFLHCAAHESVSTSVDYDSWVGFLFFFV